MRNGRIGECEGGEFQQASALEVVHRSRGEKEGKCRGKDRGTEKEAQTRSHVPSLSVASSLEKS